MSGLDRLPPPKLLGRRRPHRGLRSARYARRMATDDEAYQELAAYTLNLHDAAFIHQHIVDAYAVQAAMPSDKPIRIAQALVGLFLHVEHGFTGRQVQRVHHILAAQRPDWPRFALPDDRGPITVHDVIAEPPGERRDRALEAWATSTWNACRGLCESIKAFLSSCGVTPPAA
jgi:Family of unknown function (DUF5946)